MPLDESVAFFHIAIYCIMRGRNMHDSVSVHEQIFYFFKQARGVIAGGRFFGDRGDRIFSHQNIINRLLVFAGVGIVSAVKSFLRSATATIVAIQNPEQRQHETHVL